MHPGELLSIPRSQALSVSPLGIWAVSQLHRDAKSGGRVPRQGCLPGEPRRVSKVHCIQPPRLLQLEPHAVQVWDSMEGDRGPVSAQSSFFVCLFVSFAEVGIYCLLLKPHQSL